MQDWRLTGQEDYMSNIELNIVTPQELCQKSEIWHEHCEFCMDKIDNKYTKTCYCTMDEYRWICAECFNDFYEAFNWKVFTN